MQNEVNVNPGSSNSESNSHIGQIPLKKYPALRTVSKINSVFAWIFLAISCIVALAIWGSSGEMWYLSLAIILVGGINFLVLVAFSEIIKVIIDIEDNTRRSAEAKYETVSR